MPFSLKRGSHPRTPRWLRADIETIARMLMERHTLTGEEIDAALPPGFMARPITWPLAFVEVEDAL